MIQNYLFVRNGLTEDEYDIAVKETVNEMIGDDIPKLIILAGAPASGKTILSEVRRRTEQYFFHVPISQDTVKDKLQSKLAIPPDIAKEWRSLAQPFTWNITKEILHRALLKNVNIIFDATLGKINKYLELFHFISENNLPYTLELDLIYTTLDTAISRNAIREESTGHGVPEEAIRKIFSYIPGNIIALFDYFERITFWDNNKNIDLEAIEDIESFVDSVFFDMTRYEDSVLISEYDEDKLMYYFGDLYGNFEDVLEKFSVVDDPYFFYEED